MRIKIHSTSVKDSPHLGGKEMLAKCQVGDNDAIFYTTSELQAMKNFADEDCLKSIEYALGLMIMIEFCWNELDRIYCAKLDLQNEN